MAAALTWASEGVARIRRPWSSLAAMDGWLARYGVMVTAAPPENEWILGARRLGRSESSPTGARTFREGSYAPETPVPARFGLRRPPRPISEPPLRTGGSIGAPQDRRGNPLLRRCFERGLEQR